MPCVFAVAGAVTFGAGLGEGGEGGEMVAGQSSGDGAVADEGVECRVDVTFELVVSRAHGDGDIPVVFGHIAGNELECGAQVGGGVQGPADVRPEVGVVDVAVGECLQGGELVAVKAAEKAPLAEAVIGDRAGLGPDALGGRAAECRERGDGGAILAVYEQIAGPAVGPGIGDFPGQRLVVGDRVGVDGLAEDEVAGVLEERSHGRLVLDVEPFDPQADVELPGQGAGELDVESRAVVFLGAPE